MPDNRRHYGRYRLHLPEAERAMARSLERYGQLSPVVVCQRQQRYELIDGFKRLGAARTAHISHLSARLLEADERTAKAAIYGLNRAGRRTREFWERNCSPRPSPEAAPPLGSAQPARTPISDEA